jgi:hypothetical protein
MPAGEPPWLWDDSLYVVTEQGQALSVSVLVVYFHPDATHADLEAAVAEVDGRVVGGVPSDSGQTHYVLVEGDGTVDGAVRIADQLRSLPPVRDAHPNGHVAPDIGQKPVGVRD